MPVFLNRECGRALGHVRREGDPRRRRRRGGGAAARRSVAIHALITLEARFIKNSRRGGETQREIREAHTSGIPYITPILELTAFGTNLFWTCQIAKEHTAVTHYCTV